MKPILFSTPMVQAILDGRKTMTRRVIKSDPTHPHWDGLAPTGWHDGHRPMQHVPYSIGDVLWVRETFNCIRFGNGKTVPYNTVYWYKSEEPDINPDNKWRPSIFMPRVAARIFLRVTNVRAERVQSILCGDMKAEGCIPQNVTGGQWQQWQRDYWVPLWNAINAKRGYGWDINPWVWVIEFERVDKPEG